MEACGRLIHLQTTIFLNEKGRPKDRPSFSYLVAGSEAERTCDRRKRVGDRRQRSAVERTRYRRKRAVAAARQTATTVPTLIRLRPRRLYRRLPCLLSLQQWRLLVRILSPHHLLNGEASRQVRSTLMGGGMAPAPRRKIKKISGDATILLVQY